tara:strand:+ start:644 stop:1411 length:768 start_codon:yes stop_codon:yes gene_type:complete
MVKSSCIYTGQVIHKRFKPKKHFFKYNVFSLLIDLSELNELSKELRLFSYNKFNILSFYDSDHGPRDGTSLISWVKDHLINNKINSQGIRIKLLCYPRVWGYVFNPLSIFFVYDKDSNLISILYEVKNTFDEQHTYVFKIDEKSQVLEHSCKKKFHVSPFIEMNCLYNFKILKPDSKLSVIINQNDDYGKLLFASQDGVKKEINNKNLAFSYMFHPLMTFKIIGAIHFEAFKLWLKGIKLVKKKLKIKNNITYEL